MKQQQATAGASTVVDATVETLESAPAPLRPRPAARTCPRILLAEDDQQMRNFLRDALTAGGYRVIPCENGWELLSHLGSYILGSEDHEDIAAVVSDVRMPGVNGLEVLAGGVGCREFPPMILITAFGDQRVHDEARHNGAWTVLDKPFDVDDLLFELALIAPPS
ncbi:MAG: response regulator [Candidatus Krumholzibacteriia bacterium]